MIEGSYCFSRGRYLSFRGPNNCYVGFYKLIALKMFMSVLMGFDEVVLGMQEYKEKLLNKLLVFYEERLVHILPWRPLMEYQDILSQ